MMVLYKNFNFNLKTVGLLGAIILIEKSILEIPNYVNEIVQN